jgi:hypothetical protein
MIRNNFFRHLSNIPGWSTKRRVVIFESDDWGSIRMPSKDAFTRLKNLGVDLESFDYARYNLNDTLENQDDFVSLFDVLDSVKDGFGNPCVFTALSVVANPDFQKIRESGFQEYYYEPFTKTLKKYYPNESVFGLWKEGIEKKLFIPQFHGREHLNVAVWMKALKMGHRSTNLAFDEGMWGFVPDRTGEFNFETLAAFQLADISELSDHSKILVDGLNLFESLFGYRAKYFVPPNGPINNSLNKVLIENCVAFRSAAKFQNESIGFRETKKTLHWLGQKDSNGIRYITRNCFFEPSQSGKDWIDSCLNDIKIAFLWKKPAIISSHRVNYIGSLNPRNRANSLSSLKILLSTIKKNWPDIEYMSTDKFGELMNHQ